MADVVATVDAPVYVADLDVLTAVTGYSVHRGALAAMNRRPLPDRASTSPPAHGGWSCWRRSTTTPTSARLLRAAAALGVDAVLLDAAERRPALSQGGQGVDGRGVRRPVGPAAGLAGRPGRRPGHGVHRAGPDPGPVAVSLDELTRIGVRPGGARARRGGARAERRRARGGRPAGPHPDVRRRRLAQRGRRRSGRLLRARAVRGGGSAPRPSSTGRSRPGPAPPAPAGPARPVLRPGS